MAKKVGVTIMGIFVLLVVGFNLYALFGKESMTGAMAGNAISGLSTGINISLIAFVLQWVILLMIIIFAYSRFLKHKREEEQKIVNYVVPKPNSKAQTNMDFFLDLIKDKKSLTIGILAKVFNVTKDQALDWAKILEEHGLVSIEYPAFSDPEVKLKKRKRKKKITEEEKKRKEQKKKEREKEEKKREDEMKKESKNKKSEEKKIAPSTPSKQKEEKITIEVNHKPGELGKGELDKKLESMEEHNSYLDQFKPKK